MASIKELLQAMINKINGKNEGVDWNENDETSPAFVKNRPFYTGDPVETEIIPQTTVAFTENSGLMAATWPENFDLVDGQTYVISWDSTDYICTGILFNNIPLLGNLGIADAGEDTGEPFIFMNQGQWLVASTDTSTKHTIGIKQAVVSINKINEKYIPNSAFTDAEWDRISNKIVDYKQVNSSLSVIDKSIYALVGTTYSDTINTTLIFENEKVYRISGTATFKNTKGNITFTCNTNRISTANNYCIYLGSFYDTYSRATLEIYLYSSNSPLYRGNLSISCRKSNNNNITYKFSLDITVNEEATVLPDICLSDSIQRVGGDIILPYTTANSTKQFRITVDDSGTISATEVT